MAVAGLAGRGCPVTARTSWSRESARSSVLDLGCGKALTSVFLAREFGARVWAADLWIGPDANWRRISEAGDDSLGLKVGIDKQEG